MKSISLYVKKDTYLTRLHPFTKLFYPVVAIAVPLLAGNPWFYLLTGGISVILLISGGILKKALPLIAFSFTILLTIFLIQGLFYEDNRMPLFTLGKLIFYREGLFHAAHIGMNILNMLLSFVLFVLATDPFDLVEELERVGLSKKAGYVITSVFQVVPQMMALKNTILDAQRSRGLETEGNLFLRAKAFLPLISPVVTGSLINTRERAVALEVRGFEARTPKLFLRDYPFRKADRIFTGLAVAALFAAVLWRVVSWRI